jgi:hypothetical protein
VSIPRRGTLLELGALILFGSISRIGLTICFKWISYFDDGADGNSALVNGSTAVGSCQGSVGI